MVFLIHYRYVTILQFILIRLNTSTTHSLRFTILLFVISYTLLVFPGIHFAKLLKHLLT